MKRIILYKGKYGATEQYAQWLSQELNCPAISLDEFEPASIFDYQHIIIGSAVYVGKLLAKSWIKRNARILQQTDTSFFIVCATPANEKENIKKLIDENIPPSLKKENNIHILPGKMKMKNLSWFDRTVLKMGASMQKDPAEKARMLRDFDEVKRENLKPLVKHIVTEISTSASQPFKKVEYEKANIQNS